MRVRRVTFVVLSAATVAVALGVGVALGSTLLRSAAKVPTCKTNACARWDSSGILAGTHKGVVSVDHSAGVGVYCVQLDPKISTSTHVVMVTASQDVGQFDGVKAELVGGCAPHGLIFHGENIETDALANTGMTLIIP